MEVEQFIGLADKGYFIQVAEKSFDNQSLSQKDSTY